ncbi:isoprenoid synthase domain-containing protein [Trametes meyenii]|nr:isoprenoid synthase domain-containing protein [Trametes meyenii]
MQRTVDDLLKRHSYKSPNTPTDEDLRRWLAEQVAGWNTPASEKFFEKTIDVSCLFAETAYGHVPLEHRRYVALYTLCLLHIDDIGVNDPNSSMYFGRRFIRGEPQPNDALESLVGLLKRAYELWPQYGADSIVTGTLESVTANHAECVTNDMAVNPSATRYPTYFRLKTGISAPFTHFIFASATEESLATYLQIVPEIEYWMCVVNDIMSFYKEELVGEMNNYVHLCAAAEQMTIPDVLQKLVDDVVDTARRVALVVSDDRGLSASDIGYRLPWNFT